MIPDEGDRGVGEVRPIPPTFIELWGVVLLGLTLGFALVFAAILLVYYLRHLPAMPSQTGAAAGDIKAALDLHKSLIDQYRDTVSFIFDLVVTKTLLPLITLLLGYLFGKTKAV